MKIYALLALLSLVALTGAQAMNNVAPIITEPLRNKSVAEEQTISFVCKASGTPHPIFTWERKGKPLNPRRNRYTIHSMPHGSVLRISPVRGSDNNMRFTCIASNGLGKGARTEAYLGVYLIDTQDFPQDYPRITVSPILKSVEKDKQATLVCEAEGRNVRIKWFKDYIPLDVHNNRRLTILPGGNLQIEQSQESDNGRYECVAYNDIGEAYSYAAMLYVKVRRVPPHFSREPGMHEVEPGKPINLTCIAVGSPMPQVKWRDGANDLVSPKIGVNFLLLEKVTETKNYTCVASSDLGNIESIAQVVVKAPGTPPRNVRARAISSTTVVVEWDEPSKPNGVIQGYKVFYTTKPNLPVILWYTQEVSSNSRIATINNLITNVTYTLCVLAYSKQGEGPVSSMAQVITQQGTNVSVPDQPRDLYATALSPNEIDVNWKPPSDTSIRIKNYKLYYNDSHLRQENHVIVDPTYPRYRLNDLTPNTAYNIKVSAMSDKGEGAATPIIQAKTYEFVPSAAPQAVSGLPQDSRSISVTWKPPPPDKRNGAITGYKIFYVKFGDGFSDDDAVMSSVDAKARKIVLGGLSVYTQYKIWVLAFTTVGDGPRSDPIRVWTDEDVPTSTPAPASLGPGRSDIACEADSITSFVPVDQLPVGTQLTWRDPACGLTSNGTHLLSTIGHNQCGTTVKITQNSVEFENELIAQSTKSTQSLVDFGDSSFVIPVKCIYPRQTQVATFYQPTQQHVRFYEKRYGHFDVDIVQYKTDKFVTPVQDLGIPRKVPIKSQIYVEAGINDQYSSGLGIHVDQCIATRTPSPSDSVYYSLIKDGCPIIPHVTLYNSTNSKVRFGVEAFRFVTANASDVVYIHCQVSVCDAATPHCAVNCMTSAGRRRRAAAGSGDKTHLLSTGPFMLVVDDQATSLSSSNLVAAISALVAVIACIVAIIGWTRRRHEAVTQPNKL